MRRVQTVSELLPWTAKIVDEISLIKTVWTEAINRDPAVTYICTGHQLPGRASLGSWLSSASLLSLQVDHLSPASQE